MSNDLNAESSAKADTVVSVRFATEEVAELKRVADAQKIPLSTLIRRSALRMLTWTPPIAQLGSNNAAPAASGWATYESASARSGSQADATSLTVSYTSPGIF
jgi:hypothetical protein